MPDHTAFLLTISSGYFTHSQLRFKFGDEVKWLTPRSWWTPPTTFCHIHSCQVALAPFLFLRHVCFAPTLRHWCWPSLCLECSLPKYLYDSFLYCLQVCVQLLSKLLSWPPYTTSKALNIFMLLALFHLSLRYLSLTFYLIDCLLPLLAMYSMRARIYIICSPFHLLCLEKCFPTMSFGLVVFQIHAPSTSLVAFVAFPWNVESFGSNQVCSSTLWPWFIAST